MLNLLLSVVIPLLYTAPSPAILYNGRPVPAPYVLIYAHRGGRGLCPESTLAAYSMAATQYNIHYVDMDINMTQDGVLVVHHDPLLNPNTTRDQQGNWITKPIPICQLTYAALKHYNVGALKSGTRYARYFPQQQPVKYAPIPTLQQVIARVKHLSGNRVGFQIEIKTDPIRPGCTASPEAFAQALNQLLIQEAIINRTEVQSFDFRALRLLKKLNPSIQTAYLTLTPESNDPRWTAGYRLENYHNSFPKMIHALGGNCWEPFEMQLTQATLHEAHKLGLKVVVWGMPEREGTEFNQAKLQQLIQWGVDGIITDRPDQLSSFLPQF